MVGIFLDGRMGNHLFQYAYILSLAKDLRTHYFVDQLKVDFILPDFFTLKDYNRYRNTFFTKFYYKAVQKRFNMVEEYHAEELKCNYTYYKGFFQSASYFTSNETLVRDNFSIKPKLREDFKKYQKHKFNLERGYIAIHVRLTDYKNVGGNNLTLPLEYYEKALSFLPAHYQNLPIIVCTDEVGEAKSMFIDYPQFNYSEGTMIEDFQWIKNATFAIISNSSFAWWAAYLNNNSNNTIIAPRYWMGQYKQQVYPPRITENLNWTWL